MDQLNIRIRERRLAMGLTLAELGSRVGVRDATIQRYESGRIKNIKRSTVAALAHALECSPSYLMGWDDSPPPPVQLPEHGSRGRESGQRLGRPEPVSKLYDLDSPPKADGDNEAQDEAEKLQKALPPEGQDQDGWPVVNRTVEPDSEQAKLQAQFMQEAEEWIAEREPMVRAIEEKRRRLNADLFPQAEEQMNRRQEQTDGGANVYFVPQEGERVDYYFKVHGDSMSDARIHDGDIVFIHSQTDVKDGDIVVAQLAKKTLMGRYYRHGNVACLIPENAQYKPIYIKNAFRRSDFTILGKAVAVQSRL